MGNEIEFYKEMAKLKAELEERMHVIDTRIHVVETRHDTTRGQLMAIEVSINQINDKLDSISDTLSVHKGADETKNAMRKNIYTVLAILASAGMGGYLFKFFGL